MRAVSGENATGAINIPSHRLPEVAAGRRDGHRSARSNERRELTTDAVGMSTMTEPSYNLAETSRTGSGWQAVCTLPSQWIQSVTLQPLSGQMSTAIQQATPRRRLLIVGLWRESTAMQQKLDNERRQFTQSPIPSNPHVRLPSTY